VADIFPCCSPVTACCKEHFPSLSLADGKMEMKGGRGMTIQQANQ